MIEDLGKLDVCLKAISLLNFEEYRKWCFFYIIAIFNLKMYINIIFEVLKHEKCNSYTVLFGFSDHNRDYCYSDN